MEVKKIERLQNYDEIDEKKYPLFCLKKVKN